jgi:MYXO-CTERM domain-containing protein
VTILAYLVLIGGIANIVLAIMGFFRPQLIDPRQVARRWTNLFVGSAFILMAVVFLTSPEGEASASPYFWPAAGLLAAGMLAAWAPWQRR